MFKNYVSVNDQDLTLPPLKTAFFTSFSWFASLQAGWLLMEEIKVNQLSVSAFVGLTGGKCEMALTRAGQPRCVEVSAGPAPALSGAEVWVAPGFIPGGCCSLSSWGLWRLWVHGEGPRHG